jgi:hypothetical protein
LIVVGCERFEKGVAAQDKATSTGPVPIVVVPDLDPNTFTIDDADRFALVIAGYYTPAQELKSAGKAPSYGSMPATVPATAVLHLRDRAWVYTPTGNGRFNRVEVITGAKLPGDMEEIVRGLDPGTEVVANALAFQSTIEQ